jgi:hypothetical protein
LILEYFVVLPGTDLARSLWSRLIVLNPNHRAIDTNERERLDTIPCRREVGLSDRPSFPTIDVLARRVTLAIPGFSVALTGAIPHELKETLHSANLVALDASAGCPAAQQSLRAMLGSIDTCVYVVVDADGPFVAGDVPALIREVRHGVAVVVRGILWRACHPVGSNILRSRGRLASLLVDRILHRPRLDVLSGLFVIERPMMADDGDP